MRFSYLVSLSYCCFDSATALNIPPVCPITDSFVDDTGSWFDALGVCAGTQVHLSQFTQASLYACVNSLTAVSVPTYLPTYLSDTPHDATHACTTCVLSLANSLVDLFASNTIRGDCFFNDSGDWIWDSGTEFNGIYCEKALRIVVDTFNACSNNGYDIATKLASTRCTVSEFVNLQMNYDPYESIAPVAMINGGTIIINTNVYNTVGLTDEYASLSSVCETALDTFVTNLENLISGTSGACFEVATPFAPLPLEGACLADTDMSAALTEFTTDSGGYVLRTIASTHCTDATDIALINEVLLPFQALTKCSTEQLFTDQETCVDLVNGLFDSIDSTINCYPCFVDYMQDVYNSAAMQEVCLIDPTQAICPLVGNLMNAPLYNFAMCAGFEMNTNVTVCTPTEKTDMGVPFTSFGQIATCGLLGTEAEQNACIANVHPLYDGFMENSVSGCLSCYWALLQDISVMNEITNSDVGLACRNPFTAECQGALTGTGLPLDRFYACSGIRLISDSGIPCSASQFASLMDLNVPFESIVSFAFMANTITEAFYNFDTLLATGMTTANLTWADIPCVSCFYNLIQAGFDLPLADKETCYADINSTACSLVYGVALETFYGCSGNQVEFNEVTTTTTTTAAATTAATTTTEAATTTVASTTSKSAELLAGTGALLLALLA